MMKKWIAALLAALLLLTTFALAETAEVSDEEAEMTDAASSDWYMAVLADPEISEQFPCHCFVDVNGDGVPVLIMSTTERAMIGDEDHARVYVYDAGEARLAMEIGGGSGEKFFCDAEAHTLTYYCRMSGEAHIEVYEVKDGALTLVTKADYYAPNHGPAENADADTYYQDDQEISVEDGEALFALYADDEKVVTYEPMETANSWEDMTEEALAQVSGVSFGVPEGAEDVAYHWFKDDGLAEMLFTLDGDEYCARIKPAALEAGQLENISDMYFDWENEEEITVGGCYGTIGQAQVGSEDFVELCQWYDLAPGLMYSLSVSTTELDGLDLAAVAEMVYVPMQGDA